MTDDPRITIVKCKKKGRRYRVELESGESLKIDEEIVFRHGLFDGASFSLEQWVPVLEEAWEHECYRRLLSLLSRRPHTETEIRRKLYQRKFNKATIDKTMAKANEVGLLDDGLFARLFVDEKLCNGTQGRRKITADLQRRGVKRELIDAAFEHFAKTHGDKAEWENIVGVAEKKWRQLDREKDWRKRKQKLLAFLANRGFDAGLCYRVLDLVTGDDDEL